MDGGTDAAARPARRLTIARHSRLCRTAEALRRHACHARRRTIYRGFPHERAGPRLATAYLMMKLTRLFVPLCVSAVLLAAGESIPSQPKAFAIDPAQTKVEFALGSLLHTGHGDFRLTRGTLGFEAQSGKVSGELVVDAASGESGSPARDKRMHASILESAKFPEIIFRPDRVDGKVVPEGRSEVQVHGVFAIHGVEHEMLVPATIRAADGQYNVTGTFEVPYVKWGMKNPSTLMLPVSDKVEIIVQAVAHHMYVARIGKNRSLTDAAP